MPGEERGAQAQAWAWAHTSVRWRLRGGAGACGTGVRLAVWVESLIPPTSFPMPPPMPPPALPCLPPPPPPPPPRLHLLNHHEYNPRPCPRPAQEIDGNFIRLYWQQMLQAVKCIHDARIVHADLKPANFMLVQGQLKLIDFGIAKAIQGDTTSINRESQVRRLRRRSPGSDGILARHGYVHLLSPGPRAGLQIDQAPSVYQAL